MLDAGDYIAKDNKKSCFLCKNADVEKGYPDSWEEPGQPDAAYCTLIDKDKEDEINELYARCNDEVETAEHCPHFDPVILENCRQCGKEIKQPAYNWPHYAVTPWVNIEVCSEECKKIAEDKADKEIDEMLAPVDWQDRYEKGMVEGL